MMLAQDGETLRLAVKDCADQLGPVQPGWTRYAKVSVIDMPPPSTASDSQ